VLRLKQIDILVNNVGTGRGDALPDAIEEDAWNRIMNINLKSMAMTIRHVLPVMRQQKSGAILNISSLAAIAGHHVVTYEVSKMAVNRADDCGGGGQRQAWRTLQCHYARPDGHADGDDRNRSCERQVGRPATHGTQFAGADGADGNGVGHGLCCPVPVLG